MEDEEDTPKQFKVIFIGDGAVGKTSIILRFTQDYFDPDQRYKQTIGLDFFVKHLQINDKTQVSLQCWDIGGQTIGQKMIQNYIRGSNAIVLIYDITVQSSFDNLERWMSFVNEVFAGKDNKPYLALVGNKTDLGYKRVVKLDDHSRFANKYGMKYFFMSARTGDNVNAAMLKIASDLAGVKQTIVELETSTSQATATIQRFGEADANEQDGKDKEVDKKKKKKNEDCLIL
ncbi:MAG: putative ras family GTPase [Streblomastix strix]|uniref:Putative ras family GTPase n=1 Tax=Streblomastix strix TaxID=222440 RepID=A0A5J4X0K3_9EUKA|nr:MAG: putative ras family GTPase [Streblomastix strix]